MEIVYCFFVINLPTKVHAILYNKSQSRLPVSEDINAGLEMCTVCTTTVLQSELHVYEGDTGM